MGDLKPIKVKANVEEVLMEKYEEGGGEPLSPMARMFHEPDSNIYIITMIGFKTQINPQVFKASLLHTLLKHPRFSSVQVMDENSRGLKWVPTTVDLDNHVIVPKFEPNNIHTPDKIVEDYVSNLSKSTIKMSIPMWDLHLLNLRTSYAESTAVLRIHHSLGDGTSLMSLFLASTRKVSDPQTLPTLHMMKKANSRTKSSGGFLGNYFIKLWLVLSLFWNTFVDVLKFLATVFMFLKDTETPLKGGLGNGATTSRRFVHRMVSLDDVKLVKNAMYTELADMMKKNSFARWGNHIGYLLFPFTIALRDDPLDYLREAKATMDRKKASLEASYSYFMAKYFLKFCGLKIATFPSQTTLWFSNVPGPQEEVSYYGHPVAYVAPSCYGQPNGKNNIESPDKFVEDYVSNLSKTTIKMSIPMWDLHLLNLKTSNAETVAVLRVHHSLGDGTSLMSLFLASTRKLSDPKEPPTIVPIIKKANSGT
ncbi:hypothetical protein LWI29_029136 [Acer saccharum]|uniref:Diacylglycerol O-acyltransferase n=1 Tax=Acer saccharum TaxID=4024 RepID=A0AA39VGW2_ACESA|nr:hypothetical protein LWI29_029136 [Acer saccharum]